MSNVIRVPHTVVFEALINVDKVPASILPALIALSESELTEMCKGATLASIQVADLLRVANEGNSWAEVTIKE
jgi:hypothetical protein